MTSRSLTIMFTDIQGFTARTSGSSREGLLDLLHRHESLMIPIVKQFGGTLVKTIGDALLCTFESPTNAVLCAVAMLETLDRHNAGTAEGEHIRVRAALASGEVECVGRDVFGEAVNMAARIEGIAEAGEILLSETVQLQMNKTEVPLAEAGRHALKGIPGEHRLFRVTRDPESEPYRALTAKLDEWKPVESSGDAADRRMRRNLIVATLAIFIISLAVGVLAKWRADPEVRVVVVDTAGKPTPGPSSATPESPEQAFDRHRKALLAYDVLRQLPEFTNAIAFMRAWPDRTKACEVLAACQDRNKREGGKFDEATLSKSRYYDNWDLVRDAWTEADGAMRGQTAQPKGK